MPNPSRITDRMLASILMHFNKLNGVKASWRRTEDDEVLVIVRHSDGHVHQLDTLDKVRALYDRLEQFAWLLPSEPERKTK